MRIGYHYSYLRHWFSKEPGKIWVRYGLLVLVILLPLLLPGYILTLDLVFTPHVALPTDITNTYPLQVFLWLLHWVLPGDVIEKMILFCILLFSGVGMHLLVRALRRPKKETLLYWSVAAYFAGIFYMVNPFTYSRFMAGQWMVLMGYALFPFFARAFLRCVMLPSFQNALKAALWMAVILSVSLHAVGMLIVFGLIVTVVGVVYHRRNKDITKQLIKCLAVAVGIVTILSSYWLVPGLMGWGTINASVASFNHTHFTAFATNGDGALGAFGEVIRLQGFWAEAQQLYILPQVFVPLWGVVFLLIWILVIVGVVIMWKTYHTVAIIGLGCIIIGVLLAPTPVIEWMSHVLPFVAGYREPQKFVGLIAFGFALLGGIGAGRLVMKASQRFGEHGYSAALTASLLLPIIVTPVVFWGFAGQLSPRTYPPGWYEANVFLKKDAPNSKSVFLPWHQYARYSFSERIIASPAEKFFETSVISSDLPEFRQLPPTIPNKEKQRITEALKHSETLIKALREIGITHIIVAKEQEFHSYDYLRSQKKARVVLENEAVIIYRIEG